MPLDIESLLTPQYEHAGEMPIERGHLYRITGRQDSRDFSDSLGICVVPSPNATFYFFGRTDLGRYDGYSGLNAWCSNSFVTYPGLLESVLSGITTRRSIWQVYSDRVFACATVTEAEKAWVEYVLGHATSPQTALEIISIMRSQNLNRDVEPSSSRKEDDSYAL